jgi:hypothetical protein
MSFNSPDVPLVLLGTVVATDTKNRLIDVKYHGSQHSKQNVMVINDYGSFSFPNLDDTVLLVVNGERVYCIGKIEVAYKAQIEGKTVEGQTEKQLLTKKDGNTDVKIQAKEVGNGEIYLGNIVKRIWMLISPSGDFSLMNGLNEGLNYIRSTRLLSLAAKTVTMLAPPQLVNFGTVIRNIASIPTAIPGDVPTVPAVEGLIELYYNLVKIARFHLGNVKDTTLGVDQLGSWGARLRALIEVCTGPVPMAVLKMDELGNVELSSTSGVVMLNGLPLAGVLLSGLTSAYSAVLGESLITWLNTHTHQTGVGPSGFPITLATNALLSQQVKLS